MSRRNVNTLGSLAAGAARGRNVVVSVGTLDGPMLQALAAVRIVPAAGSDMASTWGDGVNLDTDKLGLCVGVDSSNPFSSMPEGGTNDTA